MREYDGWWAPSPAARRATDRPFPGAGHYRGHLDGLYLCGSCRHTGGNITGLPGYNAAQVVLNDLGVSAEWMPAPIAQRLAHN